MGIIYATVRIDCDMCSEFEDIVVGGQVLENAIANNNIIEVVKAQAEKNGDWTFLGDKCVCRKCVELKESIFG